MSTANHLDSSLMPNGQLTVHPFSGGSYAVMKKDVAMFKKKKRASKEIGNQVCIETT